MNAILAAVFLVAHDPHQVDPLLQVEIPLCGNLLAVRGAADDAPGALVLLPVGAQEQFSQGPAVVVRLRTGWSDSSAIRKIRGGR